MQGSKRDTDVKNRLLDSVEEGEGGMIWENRIEMCILPYVKQTTSASLMREAEHPKPEGWWGGAFRIKGHMCTCGWFMLMYGKKNIKNYKVIIL